MTFAGTAGIGRTRAGRDPGAWWFDSEAVAAVDPRGIPIVFTIVTDPVGNGYVESLARPGRNATGFMLNEYSLNAKYPELLKEIVPGITQVAVLRDANQGAGIGDFAVIQAMAPLLRMQVNVIDFATLVRSKAL